MADFDPRVGALKAWISTQAPLRIKNGLARIFGLPEFKVEVIAPDIGGAFGSKIMLFYPEEILVPCAAIRLGRPVKWIEDRVEHLLSTSQERGQLHEVEIAIDEAGRILGLRDGFLHDAGAYTPYGLIVPLITSTQLPGPYRLRNYHVEFDVVYTNKVQVTPFRGAGRAHGAFVMERIIGLIARELGLEPVEIRRRNLIQPDEFPWDVGLTFQDGAPTRYDSGDYPAGLDMALSMIGFDGFRARQAAARAEGRYLGLGVARYVEGTGIGPYEGRARPGRAERQGLRRDRPLYTRAGAPDDVRPDRRRGACLRSRRRHCRHRRHQPLQLGRRHVREPRAGDERQCRVRRGREGARQGAEPGRASSRSVGRRPRAGGRRRARQGRAATGF